MNAHQRRSVRRAMERFRPEYDLRDPLHHPSSFGIKGWHVPNTPFIKAEKPFKVKVPKGFQAMVQLPLGLNRVTLQY